MALPNRMPATAVSVFSVGGQSLLANLENATVKFNVKHEDSAGVADAYTIPWPTKGDWDIEADLFVTSGSLLLNEVGASVAVVFTAAGQSYSGTALLSTATHTAHRDGLQKFKITLMGQGAPSLA